MSEVSDSIYSLTLHSDNAEVASHNWACEGSSDLTSVDMFANHESEVQTVNYYDFLLPQASRPSQEGRTITSPELTAPREVEVLPSTGISTSPEVSYILSYHHAKARDTWQNSSHYNMPSLNVDDTSLDIELRPQQVWEHASSPDLLPSDIWDGYDTESNMDEPLITGGGALDYEDLSA